MSATISRTSFLLLFAFGLLAAGCLPTNTVRHDRRVPEGRHASHRTDRRANAQLARDARHHVRELDRVLRLDRRQERRIEHLLTDRASDRLRRTRARDWQRANPFPRRFDDRATRDWWHHTDKRIERELDRRQRRVYRDLVRYAEQRARRGRYRDQRGNRHRDYDDRRRGDDDDWDDDDWDDDDWDDDDDD